MTAHHRLHARALQLSSSAPDTRTRPAYDDNCSARRILALLTLFALQAGARRLKRTRFGARLLTNRALMLMAGDRILAENLTRSHVSHDELWAALRLAGVRNTSEVASVVLESTGAVSVLRRGAALDTALFEHVDGARDIPPELTRE